MHLKVGDLIKYLSDTGIVLDIPPAEASSHRGQVYVLWHDGKPQWVAHVMCEVISEGR